MTIQERANLLRQIEIVVDSELPYEKREDRHRLIWKLADVMDILEEVN